MSDKERIRNELLALRCMRGDVGAFNELITIWEKRLFYYIRRFTDNEQDAWDILQDTFIKAVRNFKTLADPKRLAPWLYTIARNTAYSHLRSRKREQDIMDDVREYHIQAMEDNEIACDNAREVNRILNLLSLPHKEILTLFFLEDFSIADMAEILQVPPGTVKSRLYYAKQAFKDKMEKGDRTA